MDVLWKILAENGATSVWIDIIWIATVIIISPVLFLLTMAINELPVLFVRQIFRKIRTKSNTIRFGAQMPTNAS